MHYESAYPVILRGRKRQSYEYHALLASISQLISTILSDGELSSARTSFSLKFNSAIWFLTAGVQLIVGWWYRKSAVFYLPPGWFGPLTWWLSLPFAPAGSVSCGIWQMACKRVIKVGERMVRELASGEGVRSFSATR